MKPKRYKIEKDIPVTSNHGKWTKLAGEMEVGDSVFLDNYKEMECLRRAIWVTGHKPRSGQWKDKKRTGYRVWKQEKLTKTVEKKEKHI